MEFNYLQTNFTAGEIDPKTYGRSDLTRYKNAVKKMRNFHPIAQGGAITRAGTQYITATKATTKTILVPFTYSSAISYVLEFGVGYIRFFKDRAAILSGTPYEITTTYTANELAELRFAQQANTMIIVHKNHPPARLQRYADNSWAINDLFFDLPAMYESGIKPAATITLSAATGVITVTAGAASFLVSDVGRQIQAGLGLATITGYTSTTIVTATVVNTFNVLSFTSGNWTITDSPVTSCTPSAANVGDACNLTLAVAGWRATDVGKYVFVNDGIVFVTGYSSTTVLTGVVKKKLSGLTAGQAGAWTIKDQSWSSTNGYPQAVGLKGGRLFLGGTSSKPTTIWASEAGNILNFGIGVNSADPWELNIDGGSLSFDIIQHILSGQSLAVLTYGNENLAVGKNDGPLTPTETDFKLQSSFGTNDVSPVRVGGEIIYVQRAGKKLYSLGADYFTQKDTQVPSSVSIMAEHLLSSGIISLGYAQEPYQMLHIVTADGYLTTLSIDSSQNLYGFARHDTDGLYKDVATVPNSSGDETWAIVERTINGATVQCIEVFDYAYNVDCGVKATAALQSNWVALAPHLIGETVDVLGDGQPLPQEVVLAAGTVTLPNPVTSIEVGLPFRGEIELLPIEIDQSNSLQGKASRVVEITARVIETKAMHVMGSSGLDQQVPFRRFGDNILNQPIAAFTGDVSLGLIGWADRSQPPIIIKRSVPLPCHIASIVRKMEVA